MYYLYKKILVMLIFLCYKLDFCPIEKDIFFFPPPSQ